MAEAREITVKLTADVSGYLDAMKRATQATRRLSKAYRALPRKARIIARASMDRQTTFPVAEWARINAEQPQN